MATSIPLYPSHVRCPIIEDIRLPALIQAVHRFKREKVAERTHIFRGSKQHLFCNAQKIRALKGFSASQIGSFLYSSSKAEANEQVDTAEDKANTSPSTYSFRTETAGRVKVSVWTIKDKYVVFVEVLSLSGGTDDQKLSLSEGTDDQKLVLNWSKCRSSSSVSMNQDFISSSPSASDSIFTLFAKNSSGGHEAELEFDSYEAPFYLSFLLLVSSKSNSSEVRTHRREIFCVPVGFGSGYPAPSGVSFHNDGSVNFSLFSRNSESVILCLFTDDVGSGPALEIELDPYINRTGDMWHVFLKDVGSYVSYGYKCKGKGDSFDSQYVLLDPYAKILVSFFPNKGESISLTKCLGRLCKEPSFDWTGEVKPNLPLEKLMVYRLNVGKFTEDKSSKLPNDVAGTFLGIIQKLQHFKSLGINAILLEPILPFDEKKGPYLPYHFFSPVNYYAPMCDGLSAINSMKEMVKILHANGIEVLMEVVFTQTAEGIDASSEAISYRGIDYSSYYIVGGGVGTENGNALNCNYPIVQRIILDSLHYWVTEFHIDGFCFMDASSLCHGSNGEHLSRPPLVEAIAFDPILSKTKIIADCWTQLDMSHKGIKFPHWKRWAEMNSRFCQDVRNFLRGKGLLSSLATRLCGSGDIFSHGRGPSFSFNFIAKNFGLSLVDMVSFSTDELSPELSCNCGEEGPTNKSIVLETRLKQIRNFLFILYISLGVPVLNMGDECGYSTSGSPSYTSRKPFDWRALRTGFGVQITEFIAFMSKLRMRRDDLFQSRNFLKEENIDWQANDQSQPQWEDLDSKFVALTLKAENEDKGGLFIAINASDTLQNVILPEIPEGNSWVRFIDTALSFPGFFCEDGVPVIKENTVLPTYGVKAHSCALFEELSDSA
ncbi:isoamylase 2, chloroplastic [Aristolochia californica]|uniref:isoamylase 2, chloroplastic n=1 Tax=Aristolochia californica TaxID=171875 RepID=UPI0035E00358